MRDEALRVLQRRSDDVESLERLRVEARRRGDPKPHVFDVVVLGAPPEAKEAFYYRALLWKDGLVLVARPTVILGGWAFQSGFLLHLGQFLGELPHPFSALPDYRSTRGTDGAEGRWEICRPSPLLTVMRLATPEERRDWVRFIGGAFLDCGTCGGTGSRYDESVQPRLRIQCQDCFGTGFPS